MRSISTFCLYIKELFMKKWGVFFLVLYCIAPYSWATHLKEFPKNSEHNLLPLTTLYITTVISTLEPDGEEIKAEQLRTKKHHGGTKVLVTTVELGFGSYHSGVMNGSILPPTSLINSLELCKKRDGSIGSCSRGESIIGYRRTWNIAGYGNGEFYLQAISNEYPHNTKSTRLYIQ